MDKKAFVNYVVAKNGLEKGYNLEELTAFAAFLQEKGNLIKENPLVQSYEPIFSHVQRQNREN